MPVYLLIRLFIFFEKLDVWQLSRELVKDVYNSTKVFPDTERNGLTSQFRLAVVSVSSNLAEGSARKTAKEQAHFTTIAFGSLMELLNQLILACDLEYLKESVFENLRSKIEQISNKLNALQNSQRQRITK